MAKKRTDHFSETDGVYRSSYFAKHLGDARQFHGGILFDMVGDALDVTLPADSPPEMARDIAAAGSRSSCEIICVLDREMIDDHSPLNAIGIPTMTLIDFDYLVAHRRGYN